MAYTKPGVTVAYQQGTVSPNLTPPDLFTTIVGEAYNVRDIAPDSTYEDTYSDTYTSGVEVSLSGLLDTDGSSVIADSIYVDLVRAGGRKLLLPTDLSYDQAGTLTITASGLTSAWNGAAIKIGYRETRLDKNVVTNYESVADIESKIGKVEPFNTLTWGLNWALANAGLAVKGYGLNSTVSLTGHTNAIVDLALDEDPYALSPMTHDTSIHGSYQTHVNLMSGADNKKERMLIAGRTIVWADADGTASEGSNAHTDNGDTYITDKSKTMTDIADTAFANLEKRVFWVYPDVCFISTTMHLSQLKRAYMNLQFGGAYGIVGGEFAKLGSNVVLENGTTIYKGSNITDAVWLQLQTFVEANNAYMFDVLLPAPGYYVAACVAGQRSGLRPEQPLTNVPIAGPTEVKYSGDFFSEAQLNSAANGGTYWMYQKNLAAPIVSRHQLSTNRSSTQLQEMSILSALDFSGKFIRDGVTPYIGRYTITPNFIKMLQTVVSAQGQFLVREGYLNTFSITSLIVDPIASDTILCTVEVGVKFPVNRIKFTLVF